VHAEPQSFRPSTSWHRQRCNPESAWLINISD
jgi:hypothetical protein